MTRSAKSLCESGNFFCGAICVGKKVPSPFFMLGSASADSTSRSFDSREALLKYLSQAAFA